MNEHETVTADKINDLRRRHLAGEAWTRQELKDAIFTMIGERIKEVQTPPKPKKGAAKAPPIALDDLL